MATVSRGWRLGAIAVTFGVALPVVCGDLLVVLHVVVALGEIVVALPY
jgi:hypothetical protein